MRERLRNHPAYSNQTSPNLPVASFPTEGSVFGSPTLAIQDSTFVPHAVGSEAVTELLTDNRSQVTSIRDARSNRERVALSAAAAVDGNSKSKLRYLFAGIFAVLMVCAGSLGLYLNREQLFNEPAAVEEGPAAAPDTTQPISEPVDSDQSSEAAETDAPAADGSAGSAQERRAVAPKAQPNAAKRGSNRADADDDDEVVINGDSIKAGNVMIDKGGRVTSKGSNFNFNMMPPNFPVPPIQIDPRLLTPEQRRKLRIFRQNNPLPANRPRPTPYD
jgi:hypothetical protein